MKYTHDPSLVSSRNPTGIKLSQEAIDDSAREEVTRRGEVIGTPAYLGPEALVDSSSVGTPADVYSLGVVTCELLTGGLPFEGASLVEQLMAKQDHSPQIASRSMMTPLLKQMLVRDPTRRPTIESVIVALDEALEITRQED